MTRLTTVVGWTVLGALASLAGCSGTPPGEFIIVQNQVPNADCSIPVGLGAVYRDVGTLDIRLLSDTSDGYQLFPVLQNNFPGPSAGSTLDANRIILSGYDVDISTPTDPPVGMITDTLAMMEMSGDPKVYGLLHYSTLTSGSVAGGGGNTSSSVNAFPRALATSLLGMGLSRSNTYWVLASVRARGKTLTSDVRSDAFTYPIQLCDGCLMVNQGPCPVMAGVGNGCFIGQDGATGCCTLNGSLVCPSMVAGQ
jgi:hypothetical protein